MIDEFQYLFAETRRGHPPGRAAAGGPRPPRSRRRASTSCWPARTCPASRRSGAGRRSSSSSCCASRLPRARRVLDREQRRPMDLPRWHAVVNHESGVPHGNEDRSHPRSRRRRPSTRCSERLHERYVRRGGAAPAVRRQPRPRASRELMRMACGRRTEQARRARRPVHRRGAAARRPSPLPDAAGPQHRRPRRRTPDDAVRVLAAAAASLGLPAPSRRGRFRARRAGRRGGRTGGRRSRDRLFAPRHR